MASPFPKLTFFFNRNLQPPILSLLPSSFPPFSLKIFSRHSSLNNGKKRKMKLSSLYHLVCRNPQLKHSLITLPSLLSFCKKSNPSSSFLVAIYSRRKRETSVKKQVMHEDLSRRSWSEAMPLDDDGVKCSPGSCME